MMFSKGKTYFFINYYGRLVTNFNMAAPDEVIIVINTSMAAFGTYKKTRERHLDENTVVYLSNSAATSGGTTNLGNNLGLYHPTGLSKSRMKTRPPTTSTTTTSQFLC